MVTFTDLDGDVVTVKSSRGTVQDLEGALIFSADGNVPKSLFAVNLNAAFKGASFSVTTEGGGDGVVNVGRIGSNFDIGKVFIQGDLGSISVGDGVGKTAALKSLEVESLYRFGRSHGSVEEFQFLPRKRRLHQGRRLDLRREDSGSTMGISTARLRRAGR